VCTTDDAGLSWKPGAGKEQTMDRLLFGVDVSTSAAAGADPVAAARAAEALGFDFVSANDHPAAHDPRYETWMMLAWIAAATSRIRVATRVLGVPYRPPAMVAKMAETFDRLSGGRLILGLGAGASDEEFRAFGLGVCSPAEKIDGLEEAVRVIRGLWTEPGFTFAGHHYRTEAAELAPRPDRPIPIWLGTFGRRGLDITGRLADGWIPSLALAPPDQAVVMRDRILSAARVAGRDPREITCAYNLEIRVDDAPSRDPAVVAGPPDAVAERLLGFVRLGFTAMNFHLVGPGTQEQLERLAGEVLPAIRAGV
jgi:alkanesulfonate monooxygenase SsuD/methylene tetrahydromethanopterin reductase-like flavin-dependent oxidoreductase (luciferase family)